MANVTDYQDCLPVAEQRFSVLCTRLSTRAIEQTLHSRLRPIRIYVLKTRTKFAYSNSGS